MHEVEYRQVGAYISNVMPDAENISVGFSFLMGFHCPKQWEKHPIPTVLGISGKLKLRVGLRTTIVTICTEEWPAA